MINRIFIDLDETLLHTQYHDPGQDHLKFTLPDDNHTINYFTMIRPCAKTLIEFARDLVGFNNVHILTAATRGYAEKINDLAGWGFRNEDIFAREDTESHKRYVRLAYGAQLEIDPHIYANPNNVLIDNLTPDHNRVKIEYIGIWKTQSKNYLHVNDYYGVNFTNDDKDFEDLVKNFLMERYDND